MTEANPSFLSAAMALGSVAPPHATVASTREKLRMPGMSCFLHLGSQWNGQESSQGGRER